MKIAANRPNLKKHARALLGVEWTPDAEKALIRECTRGFERSVYVDGSGRRFPTRHVSHDRADHLGRIDKILRTCGVESVLLDRRGNDVSGSCDASAVRWDIQYCNAGDTYATTIMYVNGKLCIGDWESIAESCM